MDDWIKTDVEMFAEAAARFPRLARLYLQTWWAEECSLRQRMRFPCRAILDHDASLYPWAKFTKPVKGFPSALNFISHQ